MKLFLRLFFSCFLFFCINTHIIAQDTIITFQISIPIISGIDDVEEEEDGTMYMNSTDLELVNDGNDQVVGLHFQNIQLDQGGEITYAYIQFANDEDSSIACDLQIHGEATDNGTSFETVNFDLTNRTKTDINVDWSPPNWIVTGEAGIPQRTPNIDTIIQEIINRPNWEKGNDINILIEGTGRRVAEAFEGDQSLAAQLVIETSASFTTGNVENVYINELMSLNNAVPDEYGETDDWIELYNDNETGVMLEGIFISDDISDTMKWQFPEPIFIFPKSFVVIWLDDAPEQGVNHVPFKLSSGGETVMISQMQGNELVVLDEITFGSLSENVSYGRTTDGENNWVYFGEYTPNESNNGSDLFLNASVDFSIAGGFYSSGTQLILSSDDPTAEIRYTTDGELPNQNSTLYNNALTLNSTTLVKARAFQPGFISSLQKEEFYLINGTHELPVVQISIDPKYLWDEQEGMYVSGSNGITGNCSNFVPRNWNQDWERPISIQYFEPDGDKAFDLDAGMKIAGGCSRAFAMKPLNIFFRDNKVEYPLFQSLNLQEYKRFKLRMSGNDHPLTMIRDAVIHSMLENQVDIDLMAYEPVVVYLNGEYWGFYGMREFFNKHYIEAHHGVDKDSLDLIKNPYEGGEIKEGDDIAWSELTNFINNNSMQNLSNYDFVNSKMDMNEFINYNISEMYMANYDWPGNNVTVWRDRNEGKFRWMFYDLDISSGFAQWSPSDAQFNDIVHATEVNGPDWPNNPSSTLFFRSLIQNIYFQNEFVQRTCTFGQTIFAPDRANYFMDSLSARVSSEVPELIDKFNNPPTNWYMWDANPVGGSTGSWQFNLNNFKNFFEDRLDNVLNHYENYFDYDGHFNLNINFDETTKGTVVFHTNEMKVPYQYSGEYFNDVPIRIKAIPKDGYYFLKWEETGVTDPVIDFTSNIDAILTPIFLANGTTPIILPESEFAFEISPNPAKSTIFLKYKNLKSSNLNIRVYNVMGKTIYSKELDFDKTTGQYSIDVSEWARGVYFFNGRNGEVEIVEKIIVE